jgi:predicted nucleic acid-binding protein
MTDQDISIARCRPALWSEDMQHGMALDGRLRVVNPFRAMS